MEEGFGPDLFRFLPSVCIPCFLEFVPIFALIFALIFSQHKSEQIRETPFFLLLWQVPDFMSHLHFQHLSRVYSAIANFVSMLQ